MSSVFATAVAQIAHGKNLNEWHAATLRKPPATPDEETNHMSNRSDIRAALNGGHLSVKVLREKIGHLPNYGAALAQMVKEGQLKRYEENGVTYYDIASAPALKANNRKPRKASKAPAAASKPPKKTKRPPKLPRKKDEARMAKIVEDMKQPASLPPSTHLTQTVAHLVHLRDKLDDAVAAQRTLYGVTELGT